jgi:hypothetical protein
MHTHTHTLTHSWMWCRSIQLFRLFFSQFVTSLIPINFLLPPNGAIRASCFSSPKTNAHESSNASYLKLRPVIIIHERNQHAH